MWLASLFYWVIAFFVWRGDYKNQVNRWFAITAFISGFGGIPIVWEDEIQIYIHFNFTLQQKAIIDFIMALIGSFPYYIEPYTYLMLGIYYSKIFSEKIRSVLSIVLIIPTVLMYILYPPISDFITDYGVLSIWVVPYAVFCNILILRVVWKEKIPKLRKKRKLIAILTVPTTMTTLISCSIMPALGHSAWQATFYISVAQFVIFLYVAFNDGFLGGKLKFEKSMDVAMRAVTSGNAILNHTIKNQATMILAGIQNVNSGVEDKNPDVVESIELIETSTKHLLNMVRRIQDKTQEIILKREVNNLSEIIDQAVQMVNVKDGVQILTNFNTKNKIMLYCDATHVKEILINVIKNAIEALNPNQEGIIQINVVDEKKWVYIEVMDNGNGISAQLLDKVIQPFYTTKKNSPLNYGLGLSYCYNAMVKHEGILEIKSIENAGTSVFLNFPKKPNLLKGIGIG